jgi:Cu-Zn family superoxide dismutase
MEKIIKSFIIILYLAGITFIGCQGENKENVENSSDNEFSPDTTGIEEITAIAVLNPTKGNNVTGSVIFTKRKDGIGIIADIEGLKPGKHGFHIHETGDCSSPDGKSAGDHFNPFHKSHGAPTDTSRHSGDFGNIEADKDGKAHFEWVDTLISFSGPNSIIGRAVIVHEKADDLKSQPSGNAGNRLACGVIEKQQESILNEGEVKK